MAIYNEILVARYSSMLQKLFGMKGPAPVKQLAGEVAPSLPLFSGVENRVLEQWQRYGVTINQTAVAAQTNALQIRNPAGSNVVAVIEQSTFLTNVAADTFTLNLFPAGGVGDLPGPFQGLRLDSRKLLSSTCIVSNSAVSAANVGTNIKLITLQQSVMYQDIVTDDQELTLLPGDTLRVTNAVVNATNRWGLIWRERLLELSELNL